MIDTVTIHIDVGTIEVDRVAGKLHQGREHIDRETGEVIRTFGKLGSLDIWVIPNGAIRVSGSLSVYLTSNNFLPLPFDRYSEAIEKLADELGLPILDGRMSRLDFGSIITLDRPVSEYNRQLYPLNGQRRDEQCSGQTVTFKRTQSELTFYDKVAEAKGQIPNGYDGSHVLRIEQRLTNHVERQISPFVPRVQTLLQCDFQQSLITYWLNAYGHIGKQRVRVMTTGSRTPREFKDELTLRHIQRVGEATIYAELQLKKERGEMTPENYKEARKKIGELLKKSTIVDHDIIAELDMKVQQEADRLRKSI